MQKFHLPLRPNIKSVWVQSSIKSFYIASVARCAYSPGGGGGGELVGV